MKLIELAKNVMKELQEADEKYILINNRPEKIVTIEMIQIKETPQSTPRFQIVTEKGTMLILTPSEFLRKKYEIVKNGERKTIKGA